MRKISSLIILALAAAFLLTSCGITPDAGDGSDGVTLTIMGKESDLKKSYMTRIFGQYETATGNKLELIAVEDAEFENAASEKFAGGEAPDIFMHFNNADLRRFDVENNFYYLNDEKWVSDLTDGADSYCRDRDGNLLGLPFWESSVSGCYYNKTLLDSLGLKPATNQAEFDVLCAALSATGYTPICWPADGCSWMAQFGLDPLFSDDPTLLERLNNNEISYADIPEVTDMVQWIADAADKGWLGSDYLDKGWSDISPTMSSGEAVMTFIWDTWFYTDFEKGNKYSVDDFALMPVFLNTAPDGTYEGGNLNMMMVNKNGAHLSEALDFLSFCASEENYNIAFDGISTESCFKGETSNIRSKMVTDVSASVAEKSRVSTAVSGIVGYSADDVAEALNAMLRKKTDVQGCVRLMDECRLTRAAGR